MGVKVILSKLVCLSSENRSALRGTKFFVFKVEPFFQNGTGVQETKQETTKVVSLIKQCRKYVYPVLFNA